MLHLYLPQMLELLLEGFVDLFWYRFFQWKLHSSLVFHAAHQKAFFHFEPLHKDKDVWIWKEIIKLKNKKSKILTVGFPFAQLWWCISSVQNRKFNMKIQETQAPILLHVWLRTFFTRTVTDWSFALSFAELESQLAISLAFHKMEHSA